MSVKTCATLRPGEVKAAIVTCGGLCPGLNDVIRQLVITLDDYGVKDVKGIRYGFRGFFEQDGDLRQGLNLRIKRGKIRRVLTDGDS